MDKKNISQINRRTVSKKIDRYENSQESLRERADPHPQNHHRIMGVEPYATKVESLLNPFMKGREKMSNLDDKRRRNLEGVLHRKRQGRSNKTKNLLKDLTQGDFKLVEVPTFYRLIQDSLSNVESEPPYVTSQIEHRQL